MSPCRHDFHSTTPKFQITLSKNERALRGRYRCKSTRIAPNSTSPTDLLIGLCVLSLFLAVLIWNGHTFQKGHSVLRCTFRFYFTLISQSIMGTLEAHSRACVYLASFGSPNLECESIDPVNHEHDEVQCQVLPPSPYTFLVGHKVGTTP